MNADEMPWHSSHLPGSTQRDPLSAPATRGTAPSVRTEYGVGEYARECPLEDGGHLRLPLALADFSRRGFRIDRPAARAELEDHARSFLRGFNVAARHWQDPHGALGEFPEFERGFAYEGAAMHAGLRDLATLGHAGAFRRLLRGAGDGYVHLIHVGYGWSLAPLRVPLPVRKPSTPLLRWLAVDGAGFAETYFGGVAALRRRCRRRPTQVWEARVAGSGRALWFAQSADVDGVADTIDSAAARSRPHLWSGVGLACCYAGCADEGKLGELVAASGRNWPYFAQGAMFAIAARARANVVPPHTQRACRFLFSVGPEIAAERTEQAARGLTDSAEVDAYSEWKKRLRSLATR